MREPRVIIPAEVRDRDRSGEPGNNRPDFICQLCRRSQVVSRNLFTHAAGRVTLKTKEHEQLCGICQWICIIAGNNSINYSTLSLAKRHSYPYLRKGKALCQRTFGCVGPAPSSCELGCGIVWVEQALDPCEVSEPQRLRTEKVEAVWVQGRVCFSL